MKDRILHIKVVVPRGVTLDEMAEFATSALGHWGGQFHPDDPLFPGVPIKAMFTSGTEYVFNEDGTLNGRRARKTTSKAEL